MPDMENRRDEVPERLQEVGDPRHRLRIVAPLARGLPLIERLLDIDDNKRGARSQRGHGESPGFPLQTTMRAVQKAVLPSFREAPTPCGARPRPRPTA
jgi:hypothetical protein